MDKQYNAAQHENDRYDLWQSVGGFNPDTAVLQPQSQTKNQAKSTKKIDISSKKSFCIMMPPPNANDPLHIGHATFIALEDIMIRYHRMLGDDTVWIPGTDHAGIETQFVFEKKLKKLGKSRFDFDRQTLYQMIWEYVQENSDVAVNQMKKIGASADWSRFRFMLDPNYVDEVLSTFIALHDKGLIYRDLKLVNYSPSAGTSYSELEIAYEERNSPLYYVRYYFVDAPIDAIQNNPDDPKNYLVVATTRPEPIFADTHLAVHPDNPKTKHLIGKQVKNPLTDKPMTIIADSFVDPEFGTGIVKLTPAHDHADFEVAKRHNLPIVEAITTEGRISANGGEFAGLKVKVAREQVVEILTAKNAIEKIDTAYMNRVSTDYKTGQPIEPLPLAQFFVKVEPLIEPIQKALETKELRVHGAGHDKILAHWLDTLRDWNISRQIVWGIRIPVWYDVTKNPNLQITFIDTSDNGAAQQANQQTSEASPEETPRKKPISGTISDLLSQGYSLELITKGIQTLMAPKEAEYVVSKTSPGENFIQETDTFDTWFSSAQWPFATLKSLDAQNQKTHDAQSDFNRFYPTQVMETGYDILPFWVMRMLLVGTFVTGKLPFNNVYLHGLVRDQQGKKMSKSKGNVINPLKIIDQYGADALRMALVIRSSAGQDKSIGEADFKAMRNFTNKIWNATRFIMLLKTGPEYPQSPDQKQDQEPKAKPTQAEIDVAVATFEQRLAETVTQITKHLEEFRFGLAAETLHSDFWHWFCDECIEQTKQGLLHYDTLHAGLLTFLKLLHPFMPFVTETVWQELHASDTENKESSKKSTNSILMLTPWPTSEVQ